MIASMGVARRFRRRIVQLPARVALALRFVRTPAQRVVVLWLRDHDRFGTYLLAGMARRGFSIEVVKGSAYSPPLATLRRMRVGMTSVASSRLNPRGKTLVTDDVAVARGGGWARRFLLSYDYYGPLVHRDAVANGTIVPYFMHPNVFETGLDQIVPTLRTSPKRIRVFFAGTVGAEAYGAAFTWPILNRHEVMTTLVEAAGEALEHVTRSTDRAAFLENDHVFAVALTHATENTLDKHPLTQAEMLGFAASSHFFVSPPGMRVPHSHNAIEAMGVGAIPIINYGHLFDPPLEHGRTCLRFETTDDLRDVLRQAQNMPLDSVAQLRDNVLRYFDEHLAPASFFTRLLHGEPGLATLHIFNERSPETLRVPYSRTVPTGA